MPARARRKGSLMMRFGIKIKVDPRVRGGRAFQLVNFYVRDAKRTKETG